MKVKAVRKDRTAAKLEDGKWYPVANGVQKYIEKGKIAKVDNGKIVLVTGGSLDGDSANNSKDSAADASTTNRDEVFLAKDRRISRLALINSAIEYFKLLESKDVTPDEVVKIAKLWEDYVWRE